MDELATTGKPRGTARIGRAARWVGGTAVLALAAQVALAFTGLPRWLTGWLTGGERAGEANVQCVVVLGGVGMPSGTGLIRTYRAAEFGLGRTGVTFVVALTCDADPERGGVGQMRDELVLRGIPRDAVRLEPRGRNTHEQAVLIAALLGPAALERRIVVVTSPFHVRRALMCFRRAGFRSVAGLPAGSGDLQADLGSGVLLRYRLWSNLAMTLEAARELAAIAQYRLKGWA
jgi:uncharacterized SAM-binding protein YcdF (DUF218 family)